MIRFLDSSGKYWYVEGLYAYRGEKSRDILDIPLQLRIIKGERGL